MVTPAPRNSLDTCARPVRNTPCFVRPPRAVSAHQPLMVGEFRERLPQILDAAANTDSIVAPLARGEELAPHELRACARHLCYILLPHNAACRWDDFLPIIVDEYSQRLEQHEFDALKGTD